MLRIRWRLVMGVISLVAAVAVSLPAAASKVDLGQRVADIWPNGSELVADIWPNSIELVGDIWPNSTTVIDIIWPNADALGGGSGNSQGSEDAPS